LGLLFAGLAFAFKGGALANAAVEGGNAGLGGFICMSTGLWGGFGVHDATVD
jgi:hypothetical protein